MRIATTSARRPALAMTKVASVDRCCYWWLSTCCWDRGGLVEVGEEVVDGREVRKVGRDGHGHRVRHKCEGARKGWRPNALLARVASSRGFSDFSPLQSESHLFRAHLLGGNAIVPIQRAVQQRNPKVFVVVGTRKAWRSSSSTRTPCEEDSRVCANQRNSGCSASVLHPHAEVTGFARRAMTPNAPVTAVISFCVLVSREAVLPTNDHVYDVKYTTRKPTQLTVTPIAEYELVNMSGRNSYFEPKMT